MTEDQIPPAPGPAFLVVDDNEQIRHLICQALAQLEPRAVLQAADGMEAQELLLEHPVDVAITDVLMPRMDGRELMRWAQEHCPQPLWIVLSGLDTFDAAVDALQLGAFDFLSKPLRISRLRVAARNALDQIALRRDRERLYQELEHSNTRLSTQVEQLSNLCRILEDQAELIQEDLARAEVIQRALLPRTPPQLDGWCLETLYRPGRYVGGDLYDIFELDGRYLGLVIADAAGHGVTAAMLCVLFKHRLTVWDAAAGAPLPPEEVLRRVNVELHPDTTGSGSFITAAYLLLDRTTGEASLAAAGHPPTLWINGAAGRLLDRTGPALGLIPDAAYDRERFTLSDGDGLLLYTDGLLDGGPGSPTHDDLTAALIPGGRRADVLREFHRAATSGTRHDPDDVTILFLERGEGLSRFDDASGATAAQPLPEPRDQMRMLQGTADHRGFIALAGTGTWMRSQAFFEAASAITSRHGETIIDLSDCQYLDSTFLGTLYEVVSRHADEVRLQRVPGRLRELFDELSMNAVIDRISPDEEPLPSPMEPLDDSAGDARQQARRLLEAHEMLATLSDYNRAQFQDVVKSLREDLGK